VSHLSPRRSRRRQGLACLTLAAGASVLALLLGHYAELVIPAASASAGLYLTWEEFLAGRTGRMEGPSLPAIADQLADDVRRQWEHETQVRGLNDPHPLPVSWEATKNMSEDWSYILATAQGWPNHEEKLWATNPEDLDANDGKLVRILDAVPTGRLVVLGEPGSGKTMLLVRLVTDLLSKSSRIDGAPVPVLLPLASWNPIKQDLHDWLADQLILYYPTLAEPVRPDNGHLSRARALIDGQLLLLILDGLDEISPALRRTALSRINTALRAEEQIVLSSRTKDYELAVDESAGVGIKLRGSAVVMLRDLDPADVRIYLERDAGGPESMARWHQILAALTPASPEYTAPPVGQALRTPLMVSLARAIYNPRPGEHLTSLPNPAELCDTNRFPDRADVERHLFDGFIPAAYRHSPRPAQKCSWKLSQAERYLTFLANYLERDLGGSADIAWWTLARRVGEPTRTLSWSSAALKSYLAFLMPVMLTVGLAFGLVFTPEVGLSGGLASGLVFVLALGLESEEADLTIAEAPGKVLARDRSTFLAVGFVVGPVIGLIVDIIVGLVVGPAHKGTGPGIGLVTGIPVGSAACLVFALVFRPLVGLSFGLVIGIADWIVSWLLGELIGGLTELLISGLVIGAVVGLLCGSLMTSWGSFTVARCRLAMRRRLPWRFMRFLADAHQRGALRQVGAVYQFRHARLRQRLATRYRATLEARGTSTVSGDPKASSDCPHIGDDRLSEL
jgi:hypothetical protein